MSLRDIFRLSHREITAYKARSCATFIAIGLLFGFLLGILFIVQGLENVVLRYAGSPTDNHVYLANICTAPDDLALMQKRARSYGGIVIDQSDQSTFVFPSPQDNPTAIDSFLSENSFISQFTTLAQASRYFTQDDAKSFGYSADDCQISELFTNQISVYRYFNQKNHDFILPACLVLVGISALLLAFTLAHLISNDARTFAFYRSLGASKRQLFCLYLAYLLELCAKAALFAIILALFLSVLATTLSWSYLSVHLAQLYPTSEQFPPILFGLNWQCLGAISSIFFVAPLSFLLCLDQFSNRKIAQKLKGD